MSDFTPTLGAVLKSGEEIVSSLLNKKQAIDNAAGFSQFIQAQSQVLDGMRKFQSQAITDPDIDTLPQRADENTSELFNNASKSVKNQQYAQKFQEWFAGARQDFLDNTQKVYDTRRVQKAESTFQQGVDNAVKNGDRKTLQQLFDDPTSQFIIQREQGTKKDQLDAAMGRIDLQDLTKGAMANLDAGGIEAAQAFIMDPTNLPNVSADLRQKLFEHVKALDTEKQAIQKKKYEDTNNKAVEDLSKKLGDRTLTQKDVDSAGFAGPTSGELREHWTKNVEEEHRATLSDRKASETDNPTAEELSIDASNSLIEPSVTLKKADAAFSRHEITKNQWLKVRSIASPRVKALAQPFLDDFRTDATMDQKVKTAMDSAKADFMAFVGNNMEASEEEMKKKADDLHSDAIKGVVRDAAQASFSTNPYQQRVAGAVSAAAAGKPLDIRPLAKTVTVPQVFADKKIAINGVQTTNGTTYYTGGDGKTYQVSKSGAVVVWDGRAWQTVK